MERVVPKALVILTIFLIILASEGVAGGRILKAEDNVDHPQNFIGGVAGSLFPGTPAYGTGFEFGLGPPVFCSYPGVGCVQFQPIPGTGSIGAGTGSGSGSGSPP